MKMKIAFVITGLGMGGAENLLISLADALVERGHTVCIFYMTGDALLSPKNKSIRVFSLGMKNAFSFVSAYRRLLVLLRDFRPDIVHSHMFHANILARLIRLSFNIPRLICTAHSTNEGGRLRMLTYHLTDKLADISTNVSEEAVDAFIKKRAVKPGRMISVHNGISTQKFKFDEHKRTRIRKELDIEDKQLILAVGRLVEAKDYNNLLNSISLLKDMKNSIKVLIAGDGPLKQELQDLTHKLRLEDYVDFLGIHDDIPALMSASDVFVLSSAWEGLPLVVAEAMACQRLVVATDCGGVKEVLGSAGYLVQPRQATELADALYSALNLSSQDSAAMGKAARQRVQNYYSLDVAVDKWLKLYSCPIQSIGSVN